MTRAARGPAVLLAVALLVVAALSVGVASARAAWGRPFELSKPGSLDYLGPELAFSSTGAAAAAFAIADVDTPGSAQGFLVTRSAGGAVGSPHAVAGVSQVLSLAYAGRRLELLAGTSSSGEDCCGAVEAIAARASGATAKPQTLVRGLTGATDGQLLSLTGAQMVAAIATERGVWVAQTGRGSRFDASHLISGAKQEPISMAAAWLGGSSSVVAWTAGTGIIGATTPRAIYYALGSRRGAPHGARVAVTVPAGHRIDELAVLRRPGGATLTWIESWFDRRGSYHSRVEAADLASHATARALSPDARVASGLTAGNDPAGDQAVAWESCSRAQACAVQAAGRASGGSFASARTLGAIDAEQTPALALSPAGQVLVAWVRGGHPVASVGFGSPAVLSSTTYAADPAVAYGPRHQALAAWTQGTLNPSVVAAALR